MFDVTDVMTRLTVEEGGTVTLLTLITSIDEDVDLIWKFAESKATGHSIKFKVIAERIRRNGGVISFRTERFQDRLQLDVQTGSLTLTNYTAQDIGYYKLWIPSKRISKTFDVTVSNAHLVSHTNHKSHIMQYTTTLIISLFSAEKSVDAHEKKHFQLLTRRAHYETA